LAGVILLFVPSIPQGSQTKTLDVGAGQGEYLLVENISGFSIIGSVPVFISWTSTGPMDVVAAACPHFCSNESQIDDLSSTVFQNLVSAGSISLSPPNGGAIFVGWFQEITNPPSISLTFTVWNYLPLAPPLLLGSGSALVALAVIYRPPYVPPAESSPARM
jgi:hypothetical protein